MYILDKANFSFFSQTQQPSPEKELQQAISSGNLTYLTPSLSLVDLSSPLPNGELPLHFAAKEGKLETIRTLMDKGADPMQKDYQSLTAVDHAFLQQNHDVLFTLIKEDVNEQLKTAIKEQNTPKAALAFEETTKQIKALKKGESTQAFTSLQQAILSEDLDRIKSLIENGSDIRDILLPNNYSLLHLAATTDSTELVDLLIQHGLDVETTDNFGRTAAHLAAVNSNGKILSALIKNGANLNTKDQAGVSPLALLGKAAQLRDPLQIDFRHALLFANILLQTATTIAIQTGYVEEEVADILLAGSSLASFASVIPELKIEHSQFDADWMRTIIFIGFTSIERIPFIGAPFIILRQCAVAKTAFEGIAQAYNNCRHRTWKAALNACVYGTNAAYSINNIKTTIELHTLAFKRLYYPFKIAIAGSDKKRAQYEKEYESFLKSQFFNPYTKSKVDPHELKGLSAIDRINDERLNPENPHDALLMINPNFTVDQLKSKGKSLYTKDCGNLMKKGVHPDKNQDQKEAAAAFIRLKTAKDTLDNLIKNL